jgi:hypothetical protein
MKTLNRPMFRYGGPIKEGVMNGIREPKRNGGSMANNQGPRRAALVGNPIYPQVNGRTNHVVPAVIGAGLAMPIIGAGIRAAARPFGQFVMRQVPKLIKSGKNKGQPLLDKKGVQQFYKPSKKNPATQGFDTNALGGFFARDPVVSTGGKVVSGLLSPTTGGYIQKGARLVFSPTGIATGLIYSNGKFFNKDGEEEKAPKGKVVLGDSVDIKGGGADTEPKVLTEAEKAKIESDNRIKQMDKYREIMDIKGMSKDAAYKSLIDAGKIIQEGGNLKEQLKSGKLIQNLTQAASKRFDKVGDTEAALRSLIVKGEIDKEMNKEDKALKREALKGQIAINKKSLAGLTTGEMIQKILGRAQGEYPVGDALRQIISINNPQLDAKVIPSGDIPTGTDALDYITTQITTVNNDETTPDYPEGVYVIKDRVIQVIDGQVIPIPISKL